MKKPGGPCFRTCQPAWETPPARLAPVPVWGLTFAAPPPHEPKTPVPPWPLTELSKLLLFCRQPYSTSIFHSALSPGEHRRRQKKGLWRGSEGLGSEGLGSFLRAGGGRGKTGGDGTDSSEALQHGRKEDLNKNASAIITYLELGSACLSSEVSSCELLVCPYLLYLPFLHLHPAASVYPLQCSLAQPLRCLMTRISSDCWEKIDP